jgi:hypothetical protein
MRRFILALLMTGCASTMTPAQFRVRDDFDACKQQVRAPTAWLDHVAPNGLFEIKAYGPAELRSLHDCMAARGHQMM